MEERVKQFHVDAQQAGNIALNKALKGMNTLRKFIYKNQEYRFSDKEKNKLFGAIESYFHAFDRSDASEETAFPLIEDSLKVSIFTTKQKSAMLKWYEEIVAKQEGGAKAEPKEVSTAKSKNPYYDDEYDWDEWEKQLEEDD
ncbi:hypothetical protein K493DRAFT_407487 [Basidiobolus meristosporus CBS 931.73]|uniref:Uncharacterized protein n=1 Tax=Basidiobolus meristosporus CBS 931.73 TaxID=1314790 RepID=A0A1Y1YCJ6_9FUNG|nr:hypothetical protein K493DRAFT_407487 [Basidiobolus meristosporus CBS 931.73]|eukprot:ORX95761.1 hypothetical protein K493DRAFT_407487 [Basidiobolus meristosporus CBS 931.73]